MLKRRFRPQHELDKLERVVEVAAGELTAVRDAASGAAHAIEAAAAEADDIGPEPSAAGESHQPRSQRLARALAARSEVIASSCDKMLEQLDEVHPRIKVRATGALQAPSADDAGRFEAAVVTEAAGEFEVAEPPSEGVRLLVLQMRAAGGEREAIEERLREMRVPEPGRAVDEFLE